MRILAISDIHNRVPAVQELRAREANDFDAVVVAGDFGLVHGDDAEPTICRVLALLAKCAVTVTQTELPQFGFLLTYFPNSAPRSPPREAFPL